MVIGSAASAAGRLFCPFASDRLGRKRVLGALYLGLAAGSAAFAFAGGWWVAAAYAALTFCYSGEAAVEPAFNTDLFGLPHAGVNYGFLALGMSAGSLLSYAGSQLLPMYRGPKCTFVQIKTKSTKAGEKYAYSWVNLDLIN